MLFLSLECCKKSIVLTDIIFDNVPRKTLQFFTEDEKNSSSLGWINNEFV